MATDLNTVINQAELLYEPSPTTIRGDDPQVGQEGAGTRKRTIYKFTLPAVSLGTITKVEFQVRTSFIYGSSTVEAHSLSRSDWTQAAACWTNYKASTAWTTAGGDFSATIIHSLTVDTDATDYAFILMGAGSTNPLTLNWGDTVDILFITSVESGTLGAAWKNQSQSPAPFVRITYTPTATSKMLLMF